MADPADRLPVALPHRPRQHRGPRPRPHPGRRRLRGKPFSLEELVARVRAVLRRTRRPPGRRRCCASPTSSWTRTPTRCAAATARSTSRRPSSTSCTTCSPTPAGSLEGPDPRPRLALRLRRRRERRRDLHQLPAQEDRRRRGTAADPDRARIRLRHPRPPELTCRCPARAAPGGGTVLLVGGRPVRSRRQRPTTTSSVHARPPRPAVGIRARYRRVLGGIVSERCSTQVDRGPPVVPLSRLHDHSH